MASLPVRVISRRGIAMTELSFGAAALGNLYTEVSQEQATATVRAAWDAGIRAFDVAPHYGRGLAEQRLGAALSGYPRDQYVLSTKVGRLLVPDPDAPDDRGTGFAVDNKLRRVLDYSADGVRRSLSDSLDRLGLDRIDVAYVHDPDQRPGLADQVERETMPELCRLRDEGVLRAVGVGMNQWQLPARFLESTDLDVILLAGRYTLLEQESLPGLLDRCSATGVSVVAGAAFNSGLLAADDPGPDDRWNYQTAPPAVLERARALGAACRAAGVRLPEAALAFPLGHPAVVSVLVGMRSPAEVAANAASLTGAIPAQLWSTLRAEGLLAADVPTP